MGSDSANKPSTNNTTNYTAKNGTITNGTKKNDKIKKGRDRLVEELDKLINDPDINNCFGVDYWDPDATNPDVFHWQITLIPPKGTDYEGGFYRLEVQFSEEYPLVAPIMKFVTKIYHCNINSNGHICLNTINNQWKKSYTMEDVLNHIIILLYKQNPNSPVNNSAAELYKESKTKFMEKVRQYIKEYANVDDYDNLVKQGIPPLEKCNCYFCNRVYPSIE